MKDYVEGSLVRITATFSMPVSSDVYFEFDDITVRYGTPIEDSGGEGGFEIIIDSSNNKKCYVDIDTFGRMGIHSCHFYCRGTYKAGEKRQFKVV